MPNSITMVPSCGSQNAGADCTPPAAFDPGVIVPSATGMGEAGSACAGRTFTITLIDIAQGKYNFAPDAPFTLGPSSGGGAPNECVIDFTVDVQRAPSIDANPAAPGLQTDQRSSAFAVDIGPTNAGQRASGTGTAETTVAAGHAGHQHAGDQRNVPAGRSAIRRRSPVSSTRSRAPVPAP